MTAIRSLQVMTTLLISLISRYLGSNKRLAKSSEWFVNSGSISIDIDTQTSNFLGRQLDKFARYTVLW